MTSIFRARNRLAGALVLLLSGVAAAAQQAPLAPAAGPPAVPPYTLSPGDSFDVKFDYVPELNETVKVRPDGYISLQRIGEVRVLGLTPAELTAQLRSKYAAVIRQPELNVIVRDFAVQQVFVGGEVTAPGIVPLHGSVSCLQAILATGGPRVGARLSEVILLRHLGENQAEAYRLDLKKVIDGVIQDTMLRPFDVIFVPRSKIGKVGLFVEQYINALVPRSIVFPYNLNTVVVSRVQQ
jgi:protein involved in polysaccharide export with SLBB domain